MDDGAGVDHAETRELLRHLSAEERAAVERAVRADARKAIWRPLPGPQSMAFHSVADRIGYGGAAGGGKTDLALGKALMQHQRVAFFRVNGTELSAALDRLEEILGSRDGLSGKPPIWRIDASPWRGRYWPMQIEFGSVPNAGDERKYRGRPKDLLVLDEAAEFLAIQYQFLSGWIRSTNPLQVKRQALLTFNPPTRQECRWIVDYFAPWLDPTHPLPAAPGELRWYARLPTGEEIEVESPEPFTFKGELVRPISRTFIPARLTDNPYLAETSYMATIQAMPEPLRSQMLYGDFSVGMQDDAYQVIPREWVKAAMARWRELDPLPRMDSMGVDVARGSYDAAAAAAVGRAQHDRTVIARRHGNWYDRPLVYRGPDLPDGQSVAAMALVHQRDRAPIHVDVTGIGSSPYDFLVERGAQAIAVVMSAAAPHIADSAGVLGFANMRSFIWWNMREQLDPRNNRGVALPPDNELLEELCMPRWEPRGRTIYVESRDELLDPKRLGRSPDIATAYCLAALDTPRLRDLPGPGGSARLASRNGRDYDPFDTDR